MNDVEKYQRSLSFWQMGFNFLNITNAIMKQTIKLENAWIVGDDKPISEDEYDQRTEFADFNLIIPTLFDLYHGFELVLKGDRKGLYSIRINNQWRICFCWTNGDCTRVEIVDYH